MSGIKDDSNRQVLPRWYPFAVACGMGDISCATGADIVHNNDRIDRKIEDWHAKQTVVCATDVVGTALVLGDRENSEARSAADFVLAASGSTALTRRIAKAFLDTDDAVGPSEVRLDADQRHSQVIIAELKQAVRQYPFNALAWADLAFQYAVLGQSAKAESCMNTAVSLGRMNRFVVRSAARCFLHLGEPEKSLYYLRRAAASRNDPWLISAEIAVSEGIGRKPKFAATASDMMHDGSFSPWALNELAATLSTLEGKHGNSRKCKRLLSLALREPNENTMAQAEWLSSHMGLEVNPPTRAVAADFEAQARSHFKDGDYLTAFASAEEWYSFQPFTSRPAVLASYIAGVCLDDHPAAIRVLERARQGSPHDFMLLNNLAFSYASLDRLEEANARLSGICDHDLKERDRYILKATCGLVKFRGGSVVEGREYYEQAISGFRRIGDKRALAAAAVFLAREEVRLRSSVAGEAANTALRLAERSEARELLAYISRLCSGTP